MYPLLPVFRPMARASNGRSRVRRTSRACIRTSVVESSDDWRTIPLGCEGGFDVLVPWGRYEMVRH